MDLQLMELFFSCPCCYSLRSLTSSLMLLESAAVALSSTDCVRSLSPRFERILWGEYFGPTYMELWFHMLRGLKPVRCTSEAFSN